jgi:hypothetical protein
VRPRIEENDTCDNFKKHFWNEKVELIYFRGSFE